MARRELREEKEERSGGWVRAADSWRRSGDKGEKKRREELAQIIHQPCMLLHSAIDSPAYSWRGEGG